MREELRNTVSVELGKAFDSGWHGKPPGMSKRDRVLWHRFMTKYRHPQMSVYYNCRVGSTPRETETNRKRQQEEWTEYVAPRIDAVIETEAAYMIIEVRPYAGRSALGAALTYQYLFTQNPPMEKKIIATVVTDRIPDVYRQIFDAFKVKVFCV